MNQNIFFTKFSELENRLDPLYYSGEVNGFFRNIIFPLKSLHHFIVKIDSGMGAGKDDQSDLENGVLHLRPTNIDKNGYLKLDKNIYIPFNTKYSKVEIGDVVFNNTNSQELVGKTLFIENNIDAYYSNHMTRIKINDELNPNYLWIILNFYQQKRIFFNLCTNWNNQSGVGLELLKNLKIPMAPESIQNELISIIKQSYNQKEKKEKEAQNKLDSIDTYLLNELGIKPFSYEKESLDDRVFFRKFSELSGDRFDADYYKNHYYENIHYLNQNKNFKLLTLGEISLNIFQGVGQNLTTKEENILLKVKNIMNDNKIDFENIEFIEDIPETKKLINGDIITPFIGESIKKYKFSVFNQPKNDFNYTVDNNTGVIRLKEKYNPIYVSAFFMSSIGKILIEQLSGGGGVPFLGSNSAKKLLIPIPIINNNIDFERQNKIAKHIQNLRDEAQALKDEAIQIFEDAKKEVEKMILGKSND
jgi:type I restriction enzyme, S subunit